MERKFYRISLTDHICRYFLGENLSSGSNNERVYGSLYLQNITVQRKGLFRDEIILKVPYQLFVYEDNGTFYEFFSGKMVGTRKKPKTLRLCTPAIITKTRLLEMDMFLPPSEISEHQILRLGN